MRHLIAAEAATGGRRVVASRWPGTLRPLDRLGSSDSPDPRADRVAFVFFDLHGRRVDRRSGGGARITLRAAEAPAIDVRWLASRLDWFDARGGGFTLKPQFRERFEQELAARPSRSREASSVA